MTLEDLYTEYSASVYRICLRYCKSSDQAEDLMQEVFMKIHKNLSKYSAESSYFTWIYRITTNHCLDWLRVKKRRHELTDLHIVPFHAQEARDDQETQNRLLVEKILSKLNADTRQILFLYYLEGLTYEEVAKTMGVSRAAIHKKIQKIDFSPFAGDAFGFVFVFLIAVHENVEHLMNTAEV